MKVAPIVPGYTRKLMVIGAGLLATISCRAPIANNYASFFYIPAARLTFSVRLCVNQYMDPIVQNCRCTFCETFVSNVYKFIAICLNQGAVTTVVNYLIKIRS